MVTQMMEVGEETGQISAMLDKVADFYDHEVEVATEALTAAIEPVMVVVMGAHHRRHGRLPLPADVHDLPAHPGRELMRGQRADRGLRRVPRAADHRHRGPGQRHRRASPVPRPPRCRPTPAPARWPPVWPCPAPPAACSAAWSRPIVNNALNPLVAALQGSLSTAVASAIGVSSSLSAATPATQSTPAPGTFPTDLPAGLPSPCTTTSTTKPCYYATSTSLLSLNSVASLTVGALRGYTQQVDAGADATNPIFGRAQIASTSVSVLSAVSLAGQPARQRRHRRLQGQLPHHRHPERVGVGRQRLVARRLRPR